MALFIALAALAVTSSGCGAGPVGGWCAGPSDFALFCEPNYFAQGGSRTEVQALDLVWNGDGTIETVHGEATGITWQFDDDTLVICTPGTGIVSCRTYTKCDTVSCPE